MGEYSVSYTTWQFYTLHYPITQHIYPFFLVYNMFIFQLPVLDKIPITHVLRWFTIKIQHAKELTIIIKEYGTPY